MNFVQTGAFFFTPTTLMPLVVIDFGLDLSISTVPISVGKIAYVLSLLPGGMLVDLYGPRKCVLVGILGLGITLALYAALASRFSQVILAHVTLAMFSSVSGVPVYSLFVAQWFKGGMGLAMGLVLSGYSAAGTAVPALLGPVATEVGWRAAMGCVSFAVLAVGLPVAYLFLDEKDDEAFNDFLHPAELSPILPESARDTHLVYTSPGSVDESVPAENMTGLLPALSQALPQHSTVEPRLNRPIDQSWTFIGFALNYMLLQYSFGALGENVRILYSNIHSASFPVLAIEVASLCVTSLTWLTSIRSLSSYLSLLVKFSIVVFQILFFLVRTLPFSRHFRHPVRTRIVS
jgi:MFS family permease